jgi:hypothetical protein
MVFGAILVQENSTSALFSKMVGTVGLKASNNTLYCDENPIPRMLSEGQNPEH